jgi:hypothetical protein
MTRKRLSSFNYIVIIICVIIAVSLTIVALQRQNSTQTNLNPTQEPTPEFKELKILMNESNQTTINEAICTFFYFDNSSGVFGNESSIVLKYEGASRLTYLPADTGGDFLLSNNSIEIVISKATQEYAIILVRNGTNLQASGRH